MFLLVDNKKLKALKRTRTVRAAEYWAELLAPDNDFKIIDLSVRRGWSAYNVDELRAIFRSITGRDMPDRNPSSRQVLTFSDCLHLVYNAALAMPYDDTPVDDLARKLGRDPPAPQEAFRAHVAAGGTGMRPRVPVEGDEPETRARPRRERPTAPGGGTIHARPGAGGKTAKIWDYGDAALAANPSATDKQLREAVMAEANANGLNPSMAATQFSRWNKARKAGAL